MADPVPPVTLADLRREIDRIDAAMHGLLMERGTIIDRLIEVKKTVDSGSAFRPGREASMMRTLAERHHGTLPFDTVESIWRVIIATFTYVQAPYALHADITLGEPVMRDVARFHFGFTVPYRTHADAHAVIETVAGSAGDLGMFAVETGTPWWLGLVGAHRPKIIARLPFVERPAHPAGLPVYLVSKPLEDAAIRDRVLYSVSATPFHGRITVESDALALAVETHVAKPDRTTLLVSVNGTASPDAVGERLAAAGLTVTQIDEIGSHAARFHLSRPEEPQ